uniref:RRM domain-containing protein n=1 Tax=Meloidogyne enterolobii TaxID=390850 RepID=A0A6V7U4E9_MELEN|nr:unnamed protein product [Meloidogyne enterolobii]
MSRVYIGNLSSRADERDIEDFFRGFGRIRAVMLKNGFGFVDFDDSRDAEDAVYEQNGRELCGERVVVEISRRERPGESGGDYHSSSGGGYRVAAVVVEDTVVAEDIVVAGAIAEGVDIVVAATEVEERNLHRFSARYGPPIQTRYRMLVYNLSTRCSWQLKSRKIRMRKEMSILRYLMRCAIFNQFPAKLLLRDRPSLASH